MDTGIIQLSAKKCSVCEKEKSLSEYCLRKKTRNNNISSSYFSACRDCTRENQRQRYAKNKIEKNKMPISSRLQKRRESPEGMSYCPKCDTYKPLLAFAKAKKEVNGIRYKCKLCERRFGFEQERSGKYKSAKFSYKNEFTQKQYDELFEKQDKVCAICKKLPEKRDDYNHGLVIDHDHKTGKIRGLLCRQCNHGIGHFKDDIKNLNNAIRYLEKL